MNREIMITRYPYYVISRLGPVYYFEDYDSLLRFVAAQYFGLFGNHHTEKRWRYKETPKRTLWYKSTVEGSKEVILDYVYYVAYEYKPDEEYDKVISARGLERFIYGFYGYPDPNKTRYLGSWKARYPNYPGFRNGPVPHTGGRYSSGFRRPKLTQELRMNCAHKKYVRGKRSKSYLTDYWGDYYRSDYRRKQSWKHSKKRKQWM